MQLGTVIGKVWATRKEEGLTGLKFLFVQPEDTEGAALASPLIAADRIGAGVGDKVIITCGSGARVVYDFQQTPVDAVIIGIVDSIEHERG
ncbi:EutN/CcmL family microcompartment protein [Ectobacillus ponti]|uniref:EutN/CcmL family microcompartment protein n=1 Tax=Ectobacillus ponti TaxID=2961894 RepID=A0AA42BUC6_9BACI|nr:EutN/CcmL family microcompartment protein [Ectobacillus ponti]MCP8970408.1 EutN/CcmL family microcompartment protein [Ectobacillus ponti]